MSLEIKFDDTVESLVSVYLYPNIINHSHNVWWNKLLHLAIQINYNSRNISKSVTKHILFIQFQILKK